MGTAIMVCSAMRTAATLLFMCALAAAEESDGTAMTPVTIAGLVTTHDVTEHAFIDRDVRDIEDALNGKTSAGYEEARNIYQNGKNSKLINGMRTLASFWPGLHDKSLGLSSIEEPFLKILRTTRLRKTSIRTSLLWPRLMGESQGKTTIAWGNISPPTSSDPTRSARRLSKRTSSSKSSCCMLFMRWKSLLPPTRRTRKLATDRRRKLRFTSMFGGLFMLVVRRLETGRAPPPMCWQRGARNSSERTRSRLVM